MTTEIINDRLDTRLDSEGKNIDREDYVAVWGWLWDPKKQEFSVEIDEGKGIQRFKNGTDSLEYFENVKHEDLAGGENVDINIELIQYRYGIPRVVKSRILFA